MKGYEGKVDLVHAMKAYRDSRGRASLILNLGTGSWCVVNFLTTPLYLWDGKRCPLCTLPDGRQNCSGFSTEEE
jgi:hypothetical protein